MEPKALVRAYFEAVLAWVWEFGAAQALATRAETDEVCRFASRTFERFRILGFNERVYSGGSTF